ncbi:MAG: alpha/beta hydrolase [Mycobacteriales bacterium]
MRVEATGRTGEPRPSASVAAARGACRAVVLVLSGGEETSHRVAGANSRAALRMVPFAWDLSRRARRRGVAVWRLHYRFRGWNSPEASPVVDARWALDEVLRLHGDVPVVLLGHSMGGRVAVNVADHPTVRHLVLLAPWLPMGETVAAVRGRRVLIVHGDKDRTTSLDDSQEWAARARSSSVHVDVQPIRSGEHTMIRQARLWQRLAAASVVEGLIHSGVPWP